MSGYRAIPLTSLGIASGTTIGVLGGSYALAWLLGLSPPGGYYVLLGAVAFGIAVIYDNGEKARPVKEAVLGGGTFAALSTLLSLWAVPTFLPSWAVLVAVRAAPVVVGFEFFSVWVLFTLIYSAIDWYVEQ